MPDRLLKLRATLKGKVNNLLSARGIELEKEDLASEKGVRRVLEQPREGLAQVGDRRGTGEAIIALARKFLSIIYYALKNDWIFEDFPNFVLAEAKA